MNNKVSKRKAERYRTWFVSVWSITLFLSLFYPILFSTEDNMARRILLPMIVSSVLFLEELCYAFLLEKHKKQYTNVVEVFICIAFMIFFYACVLILPPQYEKYAWLFIMLMFIVLGIMKWYKTPIVAHEPDSGKPQPVRKPK